MSFDRLIEKIKELENPTVAGLDPKLEYIPDHIKKKSFEEYGSNLEGAAEAIISYNKELIDSLYDIVPAVKPQSAYYELYGWQGVRALAETIKYARDKGMYVIVDGKRNDIGSTMEAYSSAYLGTTDIDGKEIEPFGGDALTTNAYLGIDGIKPLLDVCKKHDKGIFVLVKTSNPSSGELQDKKIGDSTVYETMGDLCESWGKDCIGKYGYSSVGAVVGATYPETLADLRKRMPHTFFLVPGYGAQGGGAKDAAGAFDQDMAGAIINSSRGIMLAYKKLNRSSEEYAAAARDEALRMKKDILENI